MPGGIQTEASGEATAIGTAQAAEPLFFRFINGEPVSPREVTLLCVAWALFSILSVIGFVLLIEEVRMGG